MSQANAKAPPPFNLRSIYIRESSISFAESFDPLIPGQPLVMQVAFAPAGYRISDTEVKSPNGSDALSYTFITEFDFAYHLGTVEQLSQATQLDINNAVARISVKIATDYLLEKETGSLDNADVVASAQSAALIHAWPYWREFAHNMMMRMNLPVMMIPLLLTPAAVQPAVAADQHKDEQAPPIAKRTRAKTAARSAKK